MSVLNKYVKNDLLSKQRGPGGGKFTTAGSTIHDKLS